MNEMRKDLVDALSQQVTRGTLSLEATKKLMLLPLVDAMGSQKELLAFGEYYRESNLHDAGLFVEDLPLLDAWYRLTPTLLFRLATNGNVDKGGQWEAKLETLITDKLTGAMHGQWVYNTHAVVIDPRRSIKDHIASLVDLDKKLAATLIVTLFNLQVFIAYNNDSDKYAVEVTTNKRALSLGNPSLPKNQLNKVPHAPRIVYLNVLPGDHGFSNSKGEGNKQRLHQRPGHWRTLMHERFKDHPKFGIKNGVRVKPYWVGLKETIHQGHTYRVLIKEDNLGDD